MICSFSSCSQNFPKANCLRLYRKLITSSTNAKGLLGSKTFEGNSKCWYLHPKSLHHDKNNIRSLNKTTYKIVLNWSQGWKNTLFALICWIKSFVGFIHKWSISELFFSLFIKARLVAKLFIWEGPVLTNPRHQFWYCIFRYPYLGGRDLQPIWRGVLGPVYMDGVPQVGEVTRLGGVTRLSI